MRIIDTNTGKVKQSIELGHYGGQFTDDGTKLAAVDKDGTVRIWEVARGRLLHTLKCPKPARAISMTPNGDRLIVYCNNNDGRGNVLVVFDGKSGAELNKRDWPNELSTPVLSPDGTKFVVTHWGNPTDGSRPKASVKIFDLSDINKEKSSFAVPSMGAMLFRPDGKAIYTVGQDAILREWDLDKGIEVSSVALGLQASGGSGSMCFIGTDRIATLNALGTVSVVRLVRPRAAN